MPCPGSKGSAGVDAQVGGAPKQKGADPTDKAHEHSNVAEENILAPPILKRTRSKISAVKPGLP